MPNKSRLRWIVLAAVGAVLAVFARYAHPFLAITEPVKADVLVVEGWVPDYVLDGAVREFKQGGYQRVFTSGLMFEKNDSRGFEGSDAVRAARHLIAAGLPSSAVEASPAPATDWNRTAAMARAVHDRMRKLELQPTGINVLTMGPHARQSRLAYQRITGPGIAVGVISIPKNDYDPARWWISAAGIKKTTKDFAGWLKELVFGSRS